MPPSTPSCSTRWTCWSSTSTRRSVSPAPARSRPPSRLSSVGCPPCSSRSGQPGPRSCVVVPRRSAYRYRPSRWSTRRAPATPSAACSGRRWPAATTTSRRCSSRLLRHRSPSSTEVPRTPCPLRHRRERALVTSTQQEVSTVDEALDPLVPRPLDRPRAVPLDPGAALSVLDTGKILAAPDDPADWPRWREQLERWRDEARQARAYDGSLYERDDLRWARG